MPPVEPNARARKPARVKPGPRILAAMIAGASVDDIATAEGLRPSRVEKLLRDELRRRWIAPVQDYARLQIARLDDMVPILKSRAKTATCPRSTVCSDLDRLDRYHGFSKQTPAMSEDYELIHRRLMAKINGAVARLPAPARGAS